MSFIWDLIFPRTCYSCHSIGSYLCPTCQENIASNYLHTTKCQPLEAYVNIFKYNSAIKNIITDIKYNYMYDIIPQISNIISLRLHKDFPNILKYWQENDYYLVPVPLYSSRYNWRGFNQAEEIAFQLSKHLKLKLDIKSLIRDKNNLPQVSLKNKLQRSKNTKNIFIAKDCPLNIILVDDVSTTLSTLKSAASSIKKSNPNSKIYGLTLAGHF